MERFDSYSQTESLIPEYCIELWAGISPPKESKCQTKSQAKKTQTDQNYLEAGHLGCKCILLTLLYVSNLCKAINKDYIIAEDMVVALRNIRKQQLINCCCSPEKFFRTVKTGVNVSKSPNKPLVGNKLNGISPKPDKCGLGCWWGQYLRLLELKDIWEEPFLFEHLTTSLGIKVEIVFQGRWLWTALTSGKGNRGHRY